MTSPEQQRNVVVGESSEKHEPPAAADGKEKCQKSKPTTMERFQRFIDDGSDVPNLDPNAQVDPEYMYYILHNILSLL